MSNRFLIPFDARPKYREKSVAVFAFYCSAAPDNDASVASIRPLALIGVAASAMVLFL